MAAASSATAAAELCEEEPNHDSVDELHNPKRKSKNEGAENSIRKYPKSDDLSRLSSPDQQPNQTSCDNTAREADEKTGGLKKDDPYYNTLSDDTDDLETLTNHHDSDENSPEFDDDADLQTENREELSDQEEFFDEQVHANEGEEFSNGAQQQESYNTPPESYQDGEQFKSSGDDEDEWQNAQAENEEETYEPEEYEPQDDIPFDSEDDGEDFENFLEQEEWEKIVSGSSNAEDGCERIDPESLQNLTDVADPVELEDCKRLAQQEDWEKILPKSFDEVVECEETPEDIIRISPESYEQVEIFDNIDEPDDSSNIVPILDSELHDSDPSRKVKDSEQNLLVPNAIDTLQDKNSKTENSRGHSAALRTHQPVLEINRSIDPPSYSKVIEQPDLYGVITSNTKQQGATFFRNRPENCENSVSQKDKKYNFDTRMSHATNWSANASFVDNSELNSLTKPASGQKLTQKPIEPVKSKVYFAEAPKEQIEIPHTLVDDKQKFIQRLSNSPIPNMKSASVPPRTVLTTKPLYDVKGRHSVLKDVQGIGLDLLPEFLKTNVLDEKYKNVEDMEVILNSSSILGNIKEQGSYLPAFACLVVGLQPRGTKSKRLIERPEKVLRDDTLNYPYNSSFRRAALTVELQPQFDVVDAPWILDQCLRYRQMLELDQLMEGKELLRSRGIELNQTHRYYPPMTKANRYDVVTRRMEYGRAEPYSSRNRYLHRNTHDAVFNDLLTGFYGAAYYGSGYCSTYGGYPLYGYNYIGKPYSSIHGLYGSSYLKTDTGVTTMTETTSRYDPGLGFEHRSTTLPPLRTIPQRETTEHTITEITTTETTTYEEEERKRRAQPPKERPKPVDPPKREDRSVRRDQQWTTTTITEVTEETTEATKKESPPPDVPAAPVKPKPIKKKPHQMVTICTFDSKQGVNADPMFQASTAKTVIVNESKRGVEHKLLSHSTTTPLNIEPVAPAVVKSATHYYYADDDEPKAERIEISKPRKLPKVPQVKVIHETVTVENEEKTTSDSSEQQEFEEYTTVQQSKLQKASSYPDIQDGKDYVQKDIERFTSMRQLSPQESRSVEQDIGQSTDSITYVFVNRARSLNSMNSENDNKKNKLLRPVSEPDWENNLQFVSGNIKKETSDTCIQTTGSLEQLYWPDFSESSSSRPKTPPERNTTYVNVDYRQRRPENYKIEPIRIEVQHPDHHRDPELRYFIQDDHKSKHSPNVIYKIIAVDGEDRLIEDARHHVEIVGPAPEVKDPIVMGPPDEEAIIAIVKAYISNNMSSVARQKQVVNGMDTIYYGGNRVIVVDQQGSRKFASPHTPRSSELYINLSGSRNFSTNLGLRDKQISEIVENYLRSRNLEKQETEGSEKGHQFQTFSQTPGDGTSETPSVFVIHDNGQDIHKQDHRGEVIYIKDKDGVERGYTIGYQENQSGAVNIYIHEIGREVKHTPPPPLPQPKPQLPQNRSLTIHVKHDKEETAKAAPLYPEYTPPRDTINTLNVNFTSEEKEKASGWDDELEKLREERRKILGLLGKDHKTNKLQVQTAEANLNYLNGQTDSMLNTTDDDELRPLHLRAPADQDPDEIELQLNVQKRNFVSHNRQETDTLDERLTELEQTKLRSAAARKQLANLRLRGANTMAIEGLDNGQNYSRNLTIPIGGGFSENNNRSLLTSKLTKLNSSSRDLLPSKFVPSPVTSKKPWMNLNTAALLRSSALDLQDANRSPPGRFPARSTLPHQNVMRRTTIKGTSSPYGLRTAPRPKFYPGESTSPQQTAMIDFNLESPLSSASATPYFKFDEIPTNYDNRMNLPFSFNASKPFRYSSERLVLPRAEYDDGGMGSMQALSRSYGSGSRLRLDPMLPLDNDVRGSFSPTLEKYSVSRQQQQHRFTDPPPRYDAASHTSSLDSAFFSDPNALSGTAHYFNGSLSGLGGLGGAMGGLGGATGHSRSPPLAVHSVRTTYK